MAEPKLESLTLDGAILHGSVRAIGGKVVSSSIDLDTFIGNYNGAFSWGGTDFSKGAQNIHLSSDHSSIEADLPDKDGKLQHSTINVEHEFSEGYGQHGSILAFFTVPHSEVHAEAESNKEADEKMLKMMDTRTEDTRVLALETVQGNAADMSAMKPGPVTARWNCGDGAEAPCVIL